MFGALSEASAPPPERAGGGASDPIVEMLRQSAPDGRTHDSLLQILRRDQVMSDRVLKYANLGTHRQHAPATHVAEALQSEGLALLKPALAGFSLFARYPAEPLHSFDARAFWSRALATGVVARHLAALAGLRSSRECFALGMLAHVGELAMASHHGACYGALHQQLLGSDPLLVVREERQRFGHDRYQLTEGLLRKWQFPEALCVAARASSNPHTYGLLPQSISLRLARLLQIATLSGELFDTRNADLQVRRMAQIKSLCAGAGILVSELTASLPQIEAEWRDWANTLGLPLAGAVPLHLNGPFAVTTEAPTTADRPTALAVRAGPHRGVRHGGALPSVQSFLPRLERRMQTALLRQLAAWRARQSPLPGATPGTCRATISSRRILRGPSGSGKTWQAMRQAVALCDAIDVPDLPDTWMGRYRSLIEAGRIRFVALHRHFHHSDLIASDATGPLAELARQAAQAPGQTGHVLILDEIQHTPLPHLFGAVWPLLLADRRAGAGSAALPAAAADADCDGLPCGLPANLHILATLASDQADASGLDAGVLRRFTLESIAPDAHCLDLASRASQVDLGALLGGINARLEYLFGQERIIGHGFLIGCRSFGEVDDALRHRIIPLLMQHSDGNWEALREVLGEQADEGRFIRREALLAPPGLARAADTPRWRYRLQNPFRLDSGPQPEI